MFLQINRNHAGKVIMTVLSILIIIVIIINNNNDNNNNNNNNNNNKARGRGLKSQGVMSLACR